MKPGNLSIAYELHDNASTLASDEQDLLKSAFQATEQSYSPHSEFKVGCSILLADNSIINGNNQENSAFPSGLCAERTALFNAGSQGKGNQIRKIAIRARSGRKLIESPATPCGACRQVMLEYETLSGDEITRLLAGEQIIREDPDSTPTPPPSSVPTAGAPSTKSGPGPVGGAEPQGA